MVKYLVAWKVADQRNIEPCVPEGQRAQVMTEELVN